jgi:hypothetical protein
MYDYFLKNIVFYFDKDYKIIIYLVVLELCKRLENSRDKSIMIRNII